MNALRLARLACAAAVPVLAFACAVRDADLDAHPAITALDATASTDQLDVRRTQLTGTISLGYVADQMVQLRVIDNGAVIHSQSIRASALELPFDQTVDLVSAGLNELSIEAELNGQLIRRQLVVDVPAALQSFELFPAANAVNVFAVTMTGTIGFGYLSDEPATIEVRVEGAIAVELEISAEESAFAQVSIAVPLAREGSNEVVATIRYAGEERSISDAVDVAMDAPVVTFPVWAQPFTPGVGLNASGNVTVVADNAYAVTLVEYAVDGGAWTPATNAGGNAWSVLITNPDVGSSDVAVRVTTVADGHAKMTEFHSVLSVPSVFLCASTTSMQPNTTLIQNQRLENRVMDGYFGRPDGGHTPAFTITATTPAGQGNETYVIVGRVIERGIVSMTVEYSVDRLQCGGNCNLPYVLAFLMDGAPVCSQTAFGNVHEY